MSEQELQRIEEIVQDLVKVMYGKDGKDGVIAKVNSDHEWIEEKKKKDSGFIVFLFRSAIFILLTFIAWKVGLSPG